MSARFTLLALLCEGPKHGRQLHEEFGAKAGDVRLLNVGRVYITLQGLARDALVASDDAGTDEPQKVFRITAHGERELARWLRVPPDLASPAHDELAAKILVALRVPGTDVHEVVQAHRQYLVELMQQWTRIKENKAGHDLGLALAVDAELFRLDAGVRWLDAADGHLEQATASPPRLAPRTLPRLRVRAWDPENRTGHEGTSGAIDDRIRISDADRERATARLRDHFAEGRLTREEFDERVMAALKARAAGDLRHVMADLPQPTLAPQQARTRPLPAVPRGPRTARPADTPAGSAGPARRVADRERRAAILRFLRNRPGFRPDSVAAIIAAARSALIRPMPGVAGEAAIRARISFQPAEVGASMRRRRVRSG